MLLSYADARSSGEIEAIPKKRSGRLCPRISTIEIDSRIFGGNSDWRKDSSAERPHNRQTLRYE